MLRWDDNSSNEEGFRIVATYPVASGDPITFSIDLAADVTSFDLATDSRTCRAGPLQFGIEALLPAGAIAASDLVDVTVPESCGAEEGAPPQPTDKPSLPSTGAVGPRGSEGSHATLLLIPLLLAGALVSTAAGFALRLQPR
jgi:hypothetical protein